MSEVNLLKAVEVFNHALDGHCQNCLQPLATPENWEEANLLKHQRVAICWEPAGQCFRSAPKDVETGLRLQAVFVEFGLLKE